MRFASICLAVLTASHLARSDAGCVLRKGTAEGGVGTLILENEYLSMTLVPEVSGACSSLVYKKTGKELVLRGPEHEAMLFKEFVRGYRYDWVRKEYEATILEESPRRVSVKLWRKGQTAALAWTTFAKTITVEQGTSLIKVEYEFSNQYDSMTPVLVPLRFHHAANIPDDTVTYFVPRRTGIQRKAYNPKAGSEEIWAYDATAGWLAAVGASAGTGFAFDLAGGYKYLMCHYVWLGSDGFTTAEWMFRTVEVKNGDSLTFTTYLTPFAGLQEVTGVGAGFVSCIDAGAESYALTEAADGIPIEATLYSASKCEATLVLSVVRSDDRSREEPIARRQLVLAPDSVASVGGTFKPAGVGTYLVKGTVETSGRAPFRFEKPVVIGEPAAEYALTPVSERTGDDAERFVNTKPLLTKPTDEDYLTWTDANPTPHTRWAKPLAAGTVKALILTDYLFGREIIELAQRLDVDFDTYTTLSQRGGRWESWWGYGGGEAGRAAKLKNYLENNTYDVIVFGGLDGGQFNADHIKLLLGQIRRGAGLVYIQPVGLAAGLWQVMPFAGEPLGERHRVHWGRARGAWRRAEKQHWITSGVPLASLPQTMYYEYTAQGEVLATVAGKPLLAVRDTAEAGRTVALSYITSCFPPHRAGLTPWVRYPRETFDYWEYYYSLLARCVLWAARKQPAVRLEKIEVSSIPAAGVDGLPVLLLTANNTGPASNCNAEITIRNAYSHLGVTRTEPVLIPAGRSTFELPVGPCKLTGGFHLLDLILTSGGKTVDWGTETFEAKSPVSVKQIVISGISPDYRDPEASEAVYRAGESIPVRVELEGEGTATLELSIVDGHGRLLQRREKLVDPGKESSAEFSILLAHPLSTVGYAQVRLVDGTATLWYEEQDFLMLPERHAERRWDDYHLLTDWGSGSAHNDHLLGLRAAAMRRLGFSILLESGSQNAWRSVRNNHEAWFRHGFRVGLVSFYNTGLQKDAYLKQKKLYAETGDKKHLQRTPSLEDPGFLDKQTAYVTQIARKYSRFSPFGYCYGDEISLTSYTDAFDFDWSPCALTAFRTWLKAEYGSLSSVNGQWGTSFASWEALVPMTSEEAVEHGNYAAWADHREFMDVSNASFYARLRAAIRDVDPGARCGLSGTQRPRAHTGSDYSKLMHVLDFLQTYGPSGFREVQDSFSDTQTAPWLGYGATRESLSDLIWRCLFHGGHGLSFYTPRNMLNPDLTPRHDAEAVWAITQPIRSGVGKLLVNAELERRVAIHYSQPSVRAAFLHSRTEQFDTNLGGWVTLIHDLGLQVTFLSGTELAEGRLQDYDVFVLPLSAAVSAKEAQATRDFVAAGGLVLADARCALFDEHCTPRPQGALDDLFGIKRGEPPPPRKQRAGTARFKHDYGNCNVVGKSFYTAALEPDISPSSGKPLGDLDGIPVGIVNEHGKGKAIYLNMPMTGYQSAMTRGREAERRRVMQGVFSLGAARSPAVITAGGELVPACEVARFTAGRLEYVGILQRGLNRELKPVVAQVRFRKKAHVYDVIQKSYLGRTDQVETTIEPSVGQVFALLPYKVKGIRVETGHSVAAGDLVNYRAKVGVALGARAGRHALRVEVYGPDGISRAFYGRKLLTAGGTVASKFASALNDAQGRWRIVVTDTASGVTGATRFTVE